MSNFAFGTPQAGNSFTFGAATTTSNLGASAFGLQQPQAQQQQTSFNLAPATSVATATSAQAATFGLSAPPYGAQTAGQSLPAMTFGAGTAATVTSAPSLGLSFGAPAASVQNTSAPTFGGFGTNTASMSLGTFGSKPNTTLGGGLSFGTPSSLAPKSTIGGFGLTTTTSTTTVSNTPKIGLGGIDVNASQPKATEGQIDSVKVKENQLPQEIIATVDSLKAYIKQQKTVSSDIVRSSSRKLSNVTSELNSLNWTLAEIHTNVETNYVLIKQLRAETTKAIQEAEIAQRTHDTLSGLQFENTAPLHYFMNLVSEFESDMLTIRKQLELTETHIRSLTNPQAFTADDLKKGLQQIHECFVALAGRLQETHRLVEIQHEQFLNLMKHRGKDKTIENVYDSAGVCAEYGNSSQPMIQQITSISRGIIPNMACGPTPFSSFGSEQFGVLHKLNSTNPSGGGFNVNGTNRSCGIGQTTTSGLSLGGSGNTFFGSTDDSYNLQKPPIGSKRNKH